MRLSKIYHAGLVYALSMLLVTLALFTIFGERGGLHLWRLWGGKKQLDERNFLLQKENEILRERIYRLKNDDYYLEKIAREELGLVRPGEIVYRFVSSHSKKGRNLSELPFGPPQSWEQKAPP